jgi:ribosomal protein S16
MTKGSDMREISLKEVEGALRQLAESNPDGHGRGPAVGECVYTNQDGTPGCVVGHVLEILGLPRPAFTDSTNTCGVETTVSSTGECFQEWLRGVGATLSDDAREILNQAQEHNDYMPFPATGLRTFREVVELTLGVPA